MDELFDVDLADDTLTRVTTATRVRTKRANTRIYQRSPVKTPTNSSRDGALSPSFSDDGDLLAFSSTASNLVFGDGNTPPRPAADGLLRR